MPFKNPEVYKAKHKEYSHEHYTRNMESVKARNKELRGVLKDQWREFKAGLCCTVCGFKHVAAIDFHHKDPQTKLASVNQLISDGRYKAAFAEVEKCVALCANCHRIHHYEERLADKKRRKKGAEAP
jgi:hypothetical protein